MIKWENKFARIIRSEVDAYLSAMGAFGWELVAASCDDHGQHELYFKRPEPKEGEANV